VRFVTKKVKTVIICPNFQPQISTRVENAILWFVVVRASRRAAGAAALPPNPHNNKTTEVAMMMEHHHRDFSRDVGKFTHSSRESQNERVHFATYTRHDSGRCRPECSFSYFLLSFSDDFIKLISIFISIFDSVRGKNGFTPQKSVFFIIK